jgi:hypothetical protein
MLFFQSVPEHRAPKPLHVGRRLPQCAQRAIGDPGSKGRREAWKTSFARRRRRADVTSNDNDGPLERRAPAASSFRVRELDGEAFALRDRRPFRDRLTGRTPRSERGDRGSTPCPGAATPWASSSTGERSFHTREVAGSNPASPIFHRRRIAQAGERLSDTEEVAGSTPAPPITARDRSSAGRALA